MYGAVFHAGYGSSGYKWDFHLSLKSNGRPDDRNLERFAEMYLQFNQDWYDANFDRISDEPEPEALRFAPDGD